MRGILCVQWALVVILCSAPTACEGFVIDGNRHTRVIRHRAFALPSGKGRPLIERLKKVPISEQESNDLYAPWRGTVPEIAEAVQPKQRLKTMLRHQAYMSRWRLPRTGRAAEASAFPAETEREIDEKYEEAASYAPTISIRPPPPRGAEITFDDGFAVEVPVRDTTVAQQFTPEEMHEMEYNAVKWFADELRLNLTDEQLHEIASSEDYPDVRLPAFEEAPLLYPAPRESFAPYDPYGPLDFGFNVSYWHMFLKDTKIRDPEVLERTYRSDKKVFIGNIMPNVTSEEVLEIAQQYGHIVNFTFVQQGFRERSKWSGAYVLYNTSEEASAAEASVRNHRFYGKRLFARRLPPVKPPMRPRFDPNSTDIDWDDADKYVSPSIKKIVDAMNITAWLPSPKPKHEYIDYEAFNHEPPAYPRIDLRERLRRWFSRRPEE